MIAKLAKSTAYFFVEKQVVKKEDEEVYAYGMELLYSSILNIAVATSSVPNTGGALPFFSYGGTAILTLLLEMGILLNISRYSIKD